MIGTLSSETPNKWTLRIPSHISPRYSTLAQTMQKIFNKYFKEDPNESIKKSYLIPKIEWSFNINLASSDKIKEWKCPSHKLKIVK